MHPSGHKAVSGGITGVGLIQGYINVAVSEVLIDYHRDRPARRVYDLETEQTLINFMCNIQCIGFLSVSGGLIFVMRSLFMMALKCLFLYMNGKL